MLIAFLENHLQADGTVTIPEVLQPYMGGLKVMVPTHRRAEKRPTFPQRLNNWLKIPLSVCAESGIFA